MASIFTYDPDPPRISSPWSNTPVSTPRLCPVQDGNALILGGLPAPNPFLLEGSGISKLDAEPQDGPTEYKLHLLLRPRKNHSAISLPTTMAAFQQMKIRGSSIQSGTAGRLSLKTSSGTPPLQARQKRLEHLTTQLLWRLQQSSPYHSQSTLRLVPPVLPESGPILSLPTTTEKLVPGLEESRGALYEIGVADDGAFIGLTKDEMDESLINLRSMASSLGCKVEILRTVIVGECEVDETSNIDATELKRSERLWVAEALVLPNTHNHSSNHAPQSPLEAKTAIPIEQKEPQPLQDADSQTSQLRVSLTGSTTSGKSSLVGTLSTSALDSGRGKTRLSLLKHRHEIESGVTSSVAPELIGYHTSNSDNHQIHVVNYGFGNISSWNDIHNAADGERLVFLLDSAGHPRYRRTTVRGLVSWSPHWTICCVAANDNDDLSARPGSAPTPEDISGLSGNIVDPSNSHLDFCLKLGLRLIVVVTKLDIATNLGLRSTLSKILTTVKAAGRNPVLLKPDPRARTSEEIQVLSIEDITEVESVFSKHDPATIVPIVLTSAVKGSGIQKLHALLRTLPIFEEDSDNISSQDAVFHIDEVFSKLNPRIDLQPSVVSILSGHLCFQDVQIGDNVLIGPCAQDLPEPPPAALSRARSYPSQVSTNTLQDFSRSAPKTNTLSSLNASSSARQSLTPTSTPPRIRPTIETNNSQDEWLQARVTSIRNLRLPLRRLLAGQVGTIGIEVLPSSAGSNSEGTNHKIRKGMVLIRPSPNSLPPRACSGLKITLPSSCYHLMEPGGLFTIYIASIRASAKITSVELPASPIDMMYNQTSSLHSTDEDDSVFLFDDPDSVQPEVTYSDSGRREVRYQPPLSPEIEVSFLFVGGREYVVVGNKALVMPTNVVEGGSGLDGIVGRVSEIF